MNGVDGFDSDKFHGLCEELKKNNTDFNLQIPQEDLNMMYASMISEFCMGDKAHLSWYNLRSHTPPKDFLEHMYVFDEDRDSFVKAMMPHTPRLVTDAYSWF